MSDTDESKSAEERRARLKALREKRRAAADAGGGDAPAAPGEGDMRGRLMKAIAKKRGLKGGGGAVAGGGGGRRRGAAGARAGAGRGAGGAGRGGARRQGAGDAGGEQFPKLRQILARRRAQGGGDGQGGDVDAAPEQQIGALKKRLQRLSDAVERTEAELAAARENSGSGGGAKANMRKKAIAKKVAAKARAARRKDSD